MSKWLKDHGLGVITAFLFIAFLLGTFLSGALNYNEDQLQHGQPTVSLGEYLVSPNFGEAVFENWESEFLQMGMLIVLTIFLSSGVRPSRSLRMKRPSKTRIRGSSPIKRMPRGRCGAEVSLSWSMRTR